MDNQGCTGLDAHVRERGVQLSGGQRQRIAIARVLLKDAPILIMDEATLALDSEVEVAIQENLETLMQGKTVIAIAHRLSTIAKMDRLLMMDNGKMAETGNHDVLRRLNGLYERLWLIRRCTGRREIAVSGFFRQQSPAGGHSRRRISYKDDTL